MKQIIQILLDRRKLYQIIGIDRKGQELKTLYYIYRTNITLVTPKTLYCVIRNEEYYLRHPEHDLCYPHSSYIVPSGINTYLISDFRVLNRVSAPDVLKKITEATLDRLAAEVAQVIRFDLKLQDELTLSNDVEGKLLQSRRLELQSEYYQPFQTTLGSLFERLEMERSLLEGHNLSKNSQGRKEKILTLLNTDVGIDYYKRQLEANNLLKSFKELD